jgi:hypothetical protein
MDIGMQNCHAKIRCHHALEIPSHEFSTAVLARTTSMYRKILSNWASDLLHALREERKQINFELTQQLYVDQAA